MAYTQVSNGVVPAIYNPMVQAMTEVKTKMLESGALVRDPRMDRLLSGAGLTFNLPSWNDLADDAENISLGASGSPATPLNITSRIEIGVRLSRNQAWGDVDLVETLVGDDPMRRIAERVAPYWARRAQDVMLATLKGVFADNTANDSGDMTVDIKASAYSEGVTDFSAEAFIDATQTMGDSEAELGLVLMHSAVYAKARKNNLIDFIPDSANAAAASIPTFLGRRVVVDDGAPIPSSGVYETFILGPGALRWGVGSPPVPVETYRLPLDANGGGSEALVSRIEWMIHPTGFSYVGTSPNGGPSNAASSNNLAAAGSWNRVVTERKQAKLARLITREA